MIRNNHANAIRKYIGNSKQKNRGHIIPFNCWYYSILNYELQEKN